jgi:hypothetical protein
VVSRGLLGVMTPRALPQRERPSSGAAAVPARRDGAGGGRGAGGHTRRSPQLRGPPRVAGGGRAGKNAAYVSLSRGGALGTSGFKAALAKDHGVAAEAWAWESPGAREIREMRWAATLERCLRVVGQSKKAARMDRKGAPWKAAVALRLKETSQASNRWLSARLHMGRPEAVSVHVGRFRRGQPQKNSDYQKLIAVV